MAQLTKSGRTWRVEAQPPPTAHPPAREKLHRIGSQRRWGIDWPPGRNLEKPWSVAEEAPRYLHGGGDRREGGRHRTPLRAEGTEPVPQRTGWIVYATKPA
ncbi:unnamed protein product [Rangifer tarandus platyrhynchus]|uniref:Uncharacterized protein n=1 Tax=Rangifer tarandus platyrhynchus TaxID=3082113 RepID=A0ABN8ZHC6_RANTA|nr:unnamed protein product [Rangifer tarandus platyrhynchus]